MPDSGRRRKAPDFRRDARFLTKSDYQPASIWQVQWNGRLGQYINNASGNAWPFGRGWSAAFGL